jgi:hypothetical protein
MRNTALQLENPYNDFLTKQPDNSHNTKGIRKPDRGYSSAAVRAGFFHPQNLGITLWIEVRSSSQTLPLEPNAHFLGTLSA